MGKPDGPPLYAPPPPPPPRKPEISVDKRDRSIVTQALFKPIIEKYDPSEWEDNLKKATIVYLKAMAWTKEDLKDESDSNS